MAELHGNLDLVALPEVLKLLADKSSTGVLTIAGDATGWIYLEEGKVRFATTREAEPVDPAEHQREQIVAVLVRLARADGGEFSFDGGDIGETPGTDAFEIGPLVTDADKQVAEWQDIESIIPSVRSELSMVTDVNDEATITLGGRSWRVLASLASSGSISEVAASLGVFEIDAARSLAQMVRDGLIEVGRDEITPDTRYAAGGRIFERVDADNPHTDAKAASSGVEDEAPAGADDAEPAESDDSELARRWREMQAKAARG